MNRIGFYLFLTTAFLSVLGIFILYESSSYTALLNVGDKYYFVKNQSLWLFLGIIISLFISKISYKRYHNLALPFLGGTIILLILVFIPHIGLSLKGARRWIDLGFTLVQPSEILKITLTLYLAAWLSINEKNRLGAFLILFLVCVALVAVEPDMGTSLIIAGTSIIVYFLSGSHIKEFVYISIILVVGAVLLIKMEPYRMSRLMAFQNFNSRDVSKTSYHVKQILVALGSGGITGVGIGNSIQKYAYLPESTTDSIFSIFAEETGLIGSVFLVSIFFLQFLFGYLISLRAKDKFGRLLAVGIISFLSIQTFVNIASQVVLVPLTGVPLPFISYGGSSMIINFVAIGILLNVSRSS